MDNKLTTIVILLIVGTFTLCTIMLLTPRYEMIEVKIVKIHTVEDYAREKELSSMNAIFPHVIYEVVETGERYSERSAKGTLGETITIKRQVGGMR
jgi:hypothetical protein